MLPSAVELLRALGGALGARRWYMFGPQAVNVYGRPRMTADVDVTLELRREELPALLADLRAAGFVVRVGDVEAFLEATSVLPFMHVSTGMPLDVVVAGSGLEAQFLDRAETHDIGGMVVPVISPSDLVVAKVLAGRPNDLEDATSVLRERASELDLDQIRRLLGEIERALDQSDLTPLLEQIISEASLRSEASPQRPKRRSKRLKR